MPGGKHAHAQAMLASEAYRCNDVGRAFGNYHHRRLLMGVEVGGSAPLVVAFLTRNVDGAPKRGPQGFERRAVYDRTHHDPLTFENGHAQPTIPTTSRVSPKWVILGNAPRMSTLGSSVNKGAKVKGGSKARNEALRESTADVLLT